MRQHPVLMATSWRHVLTTQSYRLSAPALPFSLFKVDLRAAADRPRIHESSYRCFDLAERTGCESNEFGEHFAFNRRGNTDCEADHGFVNLVEVVFKGLTGAVGELPAPRASDLVVMIHHFGCQVRNAGAGHGKMECDPPVQAPERVRPRR